MLYQAAWCLPTVAEQTAHIWRPAPGCLVLCGAPASSLELKCCTRQPGACLLLLSRLLTSGGQLLPGTTTPTSTSLALSGLTGPTKLNREPASSSAVILHEHVAQSLACPHSRPTWLSLPPLIMALRAGGDVGEAASCEAVPGPQISWPWNVTAGLQCPRRCLGRKLAGTTQWCKLLKKPVWCHLEPEP